MDLLLNSVTEFFRPFANNVYCDGKGVTVKETKENARRECSADASAVIDTIVVRGLEKVRPELFESCVDGLREVNGFDNIVHEAHIARNRLAQTRCFKSVRVTVENSVGLNATPNGYRLCFDIEEADPVSYRIASDAKSVLAHANVCEASAGGQLTCVNIENGCFLTAESLCDIKLNTTTSLTAHLPVTRKWLGFLSVFNKTWRRPSPARHMGATVGLKWSPLRHVRKFLQLDVYRPTGSNWEEGVFKGWQLDMTNRIAYDNTGDGRHKTTFPAAGLIMEVVNKFGFQTTEDAFVSTKFTGQHTLVMGKDAAVQFRAAGGLVIPQTVSNYSIKDRINTLASVASSRYGIDLTDKLLDVAPTSTFGLMKLSCHTYTNIPFIRPKKDGYQTPRLHTFAGLAAIHQSGQSSSVISSCGIGLTYHVYNRLHFEIDCFSSYTKNKTSTGYSIGLSIL